MPDECYYFTVALGPVQEFIASARRTRDLEFGSWLLSDLTRTAARKIVELHGNNEDALKRVLIFPAPANLRQLDTEAFQITNRIAALIEQSPATVTAVCRAAIQARLLHLWEGKNGTGALCHIKGPIHNVRAQAQILDLIEFTAAALPLPDKQHYASVRRQTEMLLAARKNTRDFKPVLPTAQGGWGDTVPKSSLDGLRESVIPEALYPPPGTPPEERKKMYKHLRKEYGLRRAERLDGVGLLKRHGQGSGAGFASTSHIAALPLLRRWERDGHAPADVQAFVETLISIDITHEDLGNTSRPTKILGQYDGHILFEERLADFFEDQTAIDDARQALRALLKALSPKDGPTLRPAPYYALLHADGDRMGSVIEGLEEPATHRALSEALSAFTSAGRGGVKDIVETNDGSLIYAGGDDVLALLPLHTALRCVRALQDAFFDALDRDAFKDKDGLTPTLSVGLVIAHHLDPLEDALEAARAAEKVAKQVKGPQWDKDALAITLRKRSGGDRTVQGQRNVLDARLNQAVLWHLEGKLPRGLAYEWQTLERRLAPETAPAAQQETLKKALRAEARRVAGRKRERGGGQGLADATAKALRHQVDQIGDGGPDTLSTYADELIVAAAVAEAMKLAYGDGAAPEARQRHPRAGADADLARDNENNQEAA